jgi:hypothetical protein
MTSCFTCGAVIPPGQGERRVVFTGSTSGPMLWLGWHGHLGGGYRMMRHEGVRTICHACGAKMGAAAATPRSSFAARALWWFVVFLVLNLVMHLLGAFRF